MLLLLILCVVVGICYGSGFNQTVCNHVTMVIGNEWVAKVHSSSPLTVTQVVSTHDGQLVHSQDDGRYFEIQGTLNNNVSSVCVTLLGTYQGDETPHVFMTTHQVHETERSHVTKRATQVFSVSYVTQTSDIKTLLHPFEPYHQQWGDDSLSASTKHSSSPALTVHYAKGSYSPTSHRGAGFMTTPTHLPDGTTSLILKYDVYFENFGFGIGGKLPGLFGGDNTDGAYKCSGGNHGDACFSLRLMWRENGDGEVYAYIPREHQASDFEHRSDIHINYEKGHSLMRGAIRFKSGSWQTVTEEVHLNTPMQPDGRVKFCLKHGSEPETCKEATRLNFRNHSNHFLRGLMFSTFFGGSTSNFAAPNDCHTYFRNFVLTIPSGTVVG